MANLPEHLYIDTGEGLAALCDTLASRPYIVLDTEFLRERTYRPQLCLVQIKQDEILACIDTQAIDDLQPLVELLVNPAIEKVFHAASQDLEIFYLLARSVPAPIFDTQLAAPLLGYNEQIGYGNLVKERLDVELPKAHTRADWTRRPLPRQQIAYALDDVIYLEALYLSIRAELDKLGRLAWLAPEFRLWEDPARYRQPAGDRWLRIRNIARYKGPALAVIQALAEWREIKAREVNLPRNWLLKDEILVTLAQQLPANDNDLRHIRGLERKTRERYGAELLELVGAARMREPVPLPPFAKKTKITPTAQARVQLLGAWVQQRAAELNIHAGLLAPQKLLEKMVTGDGRAALAGWREPLLGDDLQALLEGRAGLQAGKQGLMLVKTD